LSTHDLHRAFRPARARPILSRLSFAGFFDPRLVQEDASLLPIACFRPATPGDPVSRRTHTHAQTEDRST